VRARELEHRIRSLVQTHAAALLQIPGCAALTAAKTVAETARVDRFPTEGHFARYAGTAPIRPPREPNTCSGSTAEATGS
jgi:transposase